MKLLKDILLARGYLFMILGGLIFVFTFQSTYSGLDQGLYDYRDDGVITMSHAKNLVDYGHIGVNPSGERVEGFSAPVQFWTYALVYKLFGTGFMGFADAQTLICTFFLGFFFVGVFYKKWFLGALLAVPVAWFASLHFSFLEWHGSGMENAMTHAFLMGCICLLTKFLREGHISMGWAAFFVLAALSRLESIYHVGALMIMFSIVYRQEKRSWRGLRFAGIVVGIWSLYHIWRFWYFGSLEPNTGVAQNISVGENLASMWKRLDGHMEVGVRNAGEIMSAHGVWWLLVLLPLFPFINWKPQTRWIFFIGMTLVLTAFLNPFFFGQTRLDPTRSTTFLTPILGLLIAQLAISVPIFKKSLLVLPLSILVGFILYMISPTIQGQPRYICCGILRYETVGEKARTFGEENDLHRINLSTPDLGKISYLKEFNITDLGLLGSPLIAEFFWKKDYLEEYYLGFVQPDVIQIHEGFARDFGRMLTSTRFWDVYAPLDTSRGDWLQHNAWQYPTLVEGYMVRRDLMASSNSPEWQLIQAMQQSLAPARIQSELDRAVNPTDPTAHQYIVRTVYRFLPEIREADLFDDFHDLFAETPSALYDQAILASDRRRDWKKDAVAYLKEYLGEKIHAREERIAGKGAQLIHKQERHRAYINDANRVTFAFLNPTKEDSTARFHFHVHLPDSAGAPRPARMLDFFMDSTQIDFDRDELLYSVQIPKEWEPTHMIFGQHWPGHLIWEGRYNW